MDTHQRYADNIAQLFITALSEKGEKWRKPWTDKGFAPFGQFNPLSGAQYRGGNQMLLTLTSHIKGYTDNRWLTFKQARSLGAKIKKGEKATLIRYYGEKLVDVAQDDGTTQQEKRKMYSYACVFNGNQMEGLPEQQQTAPVKEDGLKLIAGQMLELNVPINFDGMGRAYYRPSTDSIHLPPQENFNSTEDFYATVLHEMAHATGHETRLNRDLTGRPASPEYAREELRAEIASFMMGSRLGVNMPLGQNKIYVKQWAQLLKDSPAEILKACSDAEKICQYLKIPLPEQEKLIPKYQRTPEEKQAQVLQHANKVHSNSKKHFARKRAERLKHLNQEAEQEKREKKSQEQAHAL